MGDIEKTSTERRGKSSQLIDNMLVERNQLLSLLLQASNLEPDDSAESDQDIIDEFCQVLVDYIAAGHFGLYDRITKKQERRKGVAELAVKVYPRIDQTTQAVLAFNEKYDPDKERNLSDLQRDLSSLGEELTTRIELEDQLITLLLGPKEAAGA